MASAERTAWSIDPPDPIVDVGGVRAVVVGCLDGSADLAAAQERLIGVVAHPRVGHPALESQALRALLVIALLAGGTQRKRTVTAIDGSRDLSDPVLQLAWQVAGTVHPPAGGSAPAMRRSFLGALVVLDSDGELGVGVGEPGGAAACAGSGGIDGALERGRWHAADRGFRDASGRAGLPAAVFAALQTDRAWLAAARGRASEVRALVEAAWDSSVPLGFHAVHRAMLAAQGLLALGAGDFEEAYLLLVGAAPPGEPDHGRPLAATLMLDLTESAARTGRTAAAQRYAAMAAGPPVQAPVDLAISRACDGLVASGARAIALLESAAVAVQDVEAPFVRARIALLHGERLRRERAVAEARLHLHAALSTFRRLGAEGWERRTAAELSAASGRSGGRAAVTARERDVASLAAHGFTNRQIGEQLLLSPRTVEAHLRHVYDKVDVRSRSGLMAAMRPAPAPIAVTGA